MRATSYNFQSKLRHSLESQNTTKYYVMSMKFWTTIKLMAKLYPKLLVKLNVSKTMQFSKSFIELKTQFLSQLFVAI